MAHSNSEPATIERVLILGDNNTSASIFKALSDASLDIHITETAAHTSHDDVAAQFHVCDLTAESLRVLLSEVDPHAVVSTTAGGSYETQQRIVNCVVENGVQRFIACEYGQDSLNEGIQARLPPSREKAKVIKLLEDLAAQQKLAWSAIAVGTVLDRGLLSGNLGFDLKWQSATLHGKGTERFAGSSAMWTGRAVLAVIRHWEDVKNRYLYAAGLITSADEIIETLQHATGQEWEVGRAEVDECVREGERRIDRGFPDAGMFLMERSVLYDEKLGAVKPFVEKDAKAELGLEGEMLEDIVHHVVHDHQHHQGKADCGCG